MTNRSYLLCPCNNSGCGYKEEVDKNVPVSDNSSMGKTTKWNKNIYLEYLSRRGMAVVVSSDDILARKAQIIDQQNEFWNQIRMYLKICVHIETYWRQIYQKQSDKTWKHQLSIQSGYPDTERKPNQIINNDSF